MNRPLSKLVQAEYRLKNKSAPAVAATPKKPKRQFSLKKYLARKYSSEGEFICDFWLWSMLISGLTWSIFELANINTKWIELTAAAIIILPMFIITAIFVCAMIISLLDRL